jgi:hypothetical protein
MKELIPLMSLPIRVSIRPGLVACVILALGALVVPGCGGDELGKRHPVSGKVTFKGEPVERGTVTFTPADPNAGIRAASGAIVGGSYQLTTQTNNDGAMPGKYKVSIQSKSFDESATLDKEGQPLRRDKMMKKVYVQAKNAIPPKYNVPETSGLTAEVPGGTYDFDLTD